ncbi:MAG: efflux transporter outer membrane subunit [Limnobacter sp.]|nr:efflux transporter outer membrane subunit [Limnobacter sp.]
MFKPQPLALLAGSFLLTACASSIEQLNPETVKPVEPLAVEVRPDERAIQMSQVEDGQWWKVVNVPSLHRVIETALERNSDVRLAEQRLNEAGAVLGIAKTAQWPAIFGEITSVRSRPTQAGNVPVFGGSNVYKATRATVSVSWELDLWGRLGDLEDAAAAQMMAQAYNYKGVRLSVSATAATLYTRIRVLRLVVEIAENTLASRKEALDLQTQRFEAGLTNELQYRQIEAEYLAVKSQLPDFRQQLAAAENALSVVLGGESYEVPPLTRADLQPTPLAFIPEETPSELLLRRPDLAAAEQQLKAAQANLSAARKAFFPSISLTGAVGSESAALDNLFTGPARIWNASVGLTQPIFQAGRLFDERDAQVARQNQVVITYEAAIRNAFAEVHDALVAQREARERLDSRAAQVESLKRLVDLAQKRVDAGVSSQLELLDAQRGLLNAQVDWAVSWGTQQAALLGVIKALGGGFQVEG